MKYPSIHRPRYFHYPYPGGGVELYDRTFEDKNKPVSQSESNAARMKANDSSADKLASLSAKPAVAPTPKERISPPPSGEGGGDKGATFRKVERPATQRVGTFGGSEQSSENNNGLNGVKKILAREAPSNKTYNVTLPDSEKNPLTPRVQRLEHSSAGTHTVPHFQVSSPEEENTPLVSVRRVDRTGTHTPEIKRYSFDAYGPVRKLAENTSGPDNNSKTARPSVSDASDTVSLPPIQRQETTRGPRSTVTGDVIPPDKEAEFSALRSKNKTQEEMNRMAEIIREGKGDQAGQVSQEIQPEKKAVQEVSEKGAIQVPPLPAEKSTVPEGKNAEDSAYLAQENTFQERLNTGTLTQKNAQSEPEFTEEGRAAFRELTLTEHEYIPGALFSKATFGDWGMPDNPTDKEETLMAQEKQFLRNYMTHAELASTPSEKAYARAERIGSQAKKNLVNGGEDVVSFDVSKGIVAGDDSDLSIEHWRNYDYTQRQHGYPQLTVFSEEKDTGGRPRISGTVVHPDDPRTKEIQETLDRGGQYPNLYTTQMDINGDGHLHKVFILPPSLRADGFAVDQSLGDVPMGPSKIGVLKEKKVEQENLN